MAFVLVDIFEGLNEALGQAKITAYGHCRCELLASSTELAQVL